MIYNRMSHPTPPRAEAKRRHSRQQPHPRHGSPTEAFELSEDEKTHNERIRARLSSHDSTRGAFFNQGKVKATTSRQHHPSGSGLEKPSNADSHAFADDDSGHDKPAQPDPFSRNDIETPKPLLGPIIDPLQYSDHSFDFSYNDSWMVSPHGSDNPLSSGSLSEMEASLRGTFGGRPRPPPATGYLPPALVQAQQQEIHKFSSMVLKKDYGTTTVQADSERSRKPSNITEHEDEENADDDEEVLSLSFYDDDDDDDEVPISIIERIKHFFDPTDWLLSDVEYRDGEPILEDGIRWTLPGIFRHVFYNPEFPEFTSLQQFSWAVIIGTLMGIYTAFWKYVIQHCVKFMWQTIPRKLLQWGVFTDLDGSFPLPHYMWIVPSIFGGILSYITVILPTRIPTQNEWIQSLHTRGVQGHEAFLPLFVLSTLAMASGMSLGPELPLLITGGMVGSMLGVMCRQSMLQARVMNLTAASGAIAGFFGFPMAGAMFVLEVPHRMGLQYFEALSPSTISSILAVLVNRMIVNNDVTGYYNYPFLTTTLPSRIFTTAIVYGVLGSGLGITYAEGVMYVKHLVHNLFHSHHHEKKERDDAHADGGDESEQYNGNEHVGIAHGEEAIPLVIHKLNAHRTEDFFQRFGSMSNKMFSFGIKHKPTRAAVTGTIAGFIVGIICMFNPIVAFWGEAQLQSLIDKGRTPLPILGGEGAKATKDLIAYGYCLIDPNDPAAVAAGFSIGCAALIASSKILVTGISLGTGIIAGHFWGPLFVGCAGSHLLTDLAILMQRRLGFGESLATYPCVSILCMMGSCHVVTFRAHMAIMLILTLTISSFGQGYSNSPDKITAGDYSAVFPLLVVSVFVSLMLSRGSVFYSAQRSRGDIMALPEVLCEPGKEGAPMVVEHFADESSDDYDNFSSSSDDDESTTRSQERRQHDLNLNKEDIERQFADLQKPSILRSEHGSESSANVRKSRVSSRSQIPEQDSPTKQPPSSPSRITYGRSKSVITEQKAHSAIDPLRASAEDIYLPSKRLEELLSQPIEPWRPPKAGRHRRIQSAPSVAHNEDAPAHDFLKSPVSSVRRFSYSRAESIGGEGYRKRSNSASRSRTSSPRRTSLTAENLVQVTSFGEFPDLQPSLMDQARERASSMHQRSNSATLPRGRHSRDGSNVSIRSVSAVLGLSGDDDECRARGARHSRQHSNTSASSASAYFGAYGDASGALSSDEVERAFSAAVNQQGLPQQTPPSALGRSIWSSESFT